MPPAAPAREKPPVVLDTITTRFLILFLFLLVVPLGTLLLFTQGLFQSHLDQTADEALSLSQRRFDAWLHQRHTRPPAGTKCPSVMPDGVCLQGLPLDNAALRQWAQALPGAETSLWLFTPDGSRLLASFGTASPPERANLTDDKAFRTRTQTLYDAAHQPVAQVIHALALTKHHELIAQYHWGAYWILACSSFFTVILAMLASRKTITQPLLKLIAEVDRLSLAEDPTQGRVQGHGVHEIHQLNTAFNRMLDRLRREHETKDEFVATLTHDLKVPLLAMGQALAYFRKGVYGPLNEEQAEVLGILQGSQQSTLDLVNGMLEIYRYEAGHATLTLQPVDVAALLQETLHTLSPLAQERSIRLRVEMAATDGTRIQADAVELRRVLWNLLSNALTNTPKHGEILCRVEDRGSLGDSRLAGLTDFQGSTLKRPMDLTPDALVVGVQDSGIGFPREELPKLFRRFAANRRRNPMSLGLGLYNCYQVVQAHGGQLWVESTEGQGAAVVFVLPRCQGESRPHA